MALDSHLVVRMQAELIALQRQLGITFVYVTHSQSEAFAMADRVVIMDRGRINRLARRARSSAFPPIALSPSLSARTTLSLDRWPSFAATGLS